MVVHYYLRGTGSKYLDLFNDVMPYTSREDLSGYLKAAWEEDALSTLKIILAR